MAVPNTEPVGSIAALSTDELFHVIGGVAETKPSHTYIPGAPWNPQPIPTPYVPPYVPPVKITDLDFSYPPKRDTSTELALSVIRRVIDDTVKSLLDEQDRKELELALAVIEGKK